VGFWDKFAQVAMEVGPIALRFTPFGAIAGPIVQGIIDARGLPGASGPDKLQHVVNIAVDAATAVNLQAGRTVLDPALVAQEAGGVVSNVYDAIKLVHDAHPATTEPPALVAPTETGAGGGPGPPPPGVPNRGTVGGPLASIPTGQSSVAVRSTPVLWATPTRQDREGKVRRCQKKIRGVSVTVHVAMPPGPPSTRRTPARETRAWPVGRQSPRETS
jgi:hypothetical protein